MSSSPIRVLLQTTIPTTEDDWSIDRFSLLQQYLANLKDETGQPLCVVTGRDRQLDEAGNDPVLSTIDRADFDQLWLFALDVGGGLSAADMKGIRHFYQQGGGILTTRDHQDMGISLKDCDILGSYHYFNTANLDPDPDRCCPDDIYTTYISYPNYHSGKNGDYQTITTIEPVHELLLNPAAASGRITYFPAHPHEGGVGVPEGRTDARVIAIGKSKVTDRPFNLVVAIERSTQENGVRSGRMVAQSTFHHFVDYNWDIDKGCPSFVDELPGHGMKENLAAIEDIKTYVKNLLLWLTPRSHSHFPS